MKKILESLKNAAIRDFNNGFMSGFRGYSKIKVKGSLVSCECKRVSGSINATHTRFDWFVDGKKVSYSDILESL